MDILKFASFLPVGELPEVVDDTFGIRIIESKRADFVPPRLKSVKDATEKTRAVLITAPAAAGKSTSAEMLSESSGALFLDLAHQRVADGSFVGLLTEALGDEPATAFRSRLRSNEATLVIDSLDETQLLSRESNFVAFLRGLCRFLRLSVGECNVVLMARLDTAEWITATFAEEGVGIAEFIIEYFDECEANKFIDLKLDDMYRVNGLDTAPHRKHRNNFVEVRNQIYARIAKGLGIEESQLWENDDARRFLGYSPVLESISSYLCVPDFRELAPSIEDTITGSDAPEWKILSSLTNSLLKREQKRFLEGWLDTVARPMFPDEKSIQALYSPGEQCQRLVAIVEKKGQNLPLPKNLPASLRSSYEDSVATQRRNHPFIASSQKFASSVLRDFAFASVLTDPDALEDIRRIVTGRLRDDTALPSPALAPFTMTLLDGHGSALALDTCDLLIASLSSQKDKTSTLQYRIFSQDRRGFFEVSRLDRATGLESRLLEIETQDYLGTGRLSLPSRFENLTLDFDGDVELSNSRELAQVGPDVSIQARSVSCEAKTLRVSDNVSLEASLVMTSYEQDVRVYGEFFIYAEEIEGPLFSWKRAKTEEPEKTELTPEFYALRRLLRFFHKTIHAPVGHLAADREKLKRFVFNSDEVAEQLLAGLRKKGLVRDVGPAVYIDGDIITSLGVSFRGINSYVTNAQLQSFLKSLLA